jgi:hypothetical protein
MRGHGLGVVWLAFLGAGACAGEDADLTTYLSPSLTAKAPHTLSVFGVFRDGRMSARAWDELSPKLTSILGPEPCPAAFSTDLVTGDGALASAIDDYSKNYGLTEPLLDRIAPAAKGDLVLVFIVAGAVRSRHHDTDPQPRPAPGPGGSRMRRTTSYSRPPATNPSAFEVTASLFSPKDHANVAAVNLRYAGPSEDAAMAKLLAKWRELFPSTSCESWDFEAHPVDADAVRALPEP